MQALWPPYGENSTFNSAHVKEDVAGEAAAVKAVDGEVLIAWQHKLIPALVNALPNPPAIPGRWPGHAFDIVWIPEASG